MTLQELMYLIKQVELLERKEIQGILTVEENKQLERLRNTVIS